MRLRALAIVGLVVMVIAGVLAAYFLLLSPYSAAQNRAGGSIASVSGSKAPFDFGLYIETWVQTELPNGAGEDQIVVSANGTGMESGPTKCICNDDDGSALTAWSAPLKFEADGDRLIAMLTSIDFQGYQSTVDDPRGGDSFEFTLGSDGLLHRKWLGRFSDGIGGGWHALDEFYKASA